MIGTARWHSRAAVPVVTALAAIGAVVGVGVAVSGPSASSGPTRAATRSVSFPPHRPDPAARFVDPVAMDALLSRTSAAVAELFTYDSRTVDLWALRVAGYTTAAFANRYVPAVVTAAHRSPLARTATVSAVGIATVHGTVGTALAFVVRDGVGQRYRVQLQAERGRWLVGALIRDGAVGGPLPGTPGLLTAVSAARTAVTGVLSGVAAGRLATAPYASELARLEATVQGPGAVVVDAVAVAATTGDSATVLVAAHRGARTFRVTVTVAQAGTTWLVGDLEILP